MTSDPQAPRTGGSATLSLCDADLGLATDLYQLTMAAAYHGWRRDEGGESATATFDLWIRKLPDPRRFLVFAGLEQALASLETLSFDAERIDWLRGQPPFVGVDDSFFELLAGFRFRGDVRAMAEGTVFFPGEPLLSVTGSLIEAQLVETLLLSIVNFQTAIASKGARLRLAGGDPEEGGVRLAEFGSRRAHGPQAGVWAARAAYVGGVDSTSNVAAGFHTGVPVVGTMAHSFVMAHVEESDAFRRYQETFPGHTILLVDTYDTLRGVERALATGGPFDGVRLDSGDLAELARGTRRLLDEGGRPDATIFASGDLNEHKIAEFRAAGAPIDAFGVGTQLATSADAPYLSGVYKLVRVERGGDTRLTFKASPGKETYPGAKQVVRLLGERGEMLEDHLLRRDDAAAFVEAQRKAGRLAEPLLSTVMRGGEIVPLEERGHTGGGTDTDASAEAGATQGALEAARRRCRSDLARLPAALRSLEANDEASVYPVVVDDALEAELHRLRRREGE